MRVYACALEILRQRVQISGQNHSVRGDDSRGGAGALLSGGGIFGGGGEGDVEGATDFQGMGALPVGWKGFPLHEGGQRRLPVANSLYSEIFFFFFFVSGNSQLHYKF